MNNQPTPAAMRAVASVFDRFFNIPAKATPDELAFLIDAELAQERERAQELEYALKKLGEQLDERFAAHTDEGIGVAIERALSVLAKHRADREGSK
jgi:regulator of sigma D